MTKRWSSTRSGGGTKREASKAARRTTKLDVLDMDEPDAGSWEEVKARLGLNDADGEEPSR